MELLDGDIIYRGNSVISVETLPEHTHPVVIKKPAKRHPSERSLRTLENEYGMTRALDTVEGVRKALGQQSLENQPALILEYIDGENLRDTIARKKLDLSSRLEIAIALARIMAGIHQQNVIHLDLNSENVLIGKEQGTVHIIDLSAASRVDRSGHQKVRPDQMLGALPYISPEQTGRINRAVDERSDLYSLGVILYELMTGQLPFNSEDPLELVHHHIARVPISPSEVSAEVPEVISSIILKLLGKNAENRYQSAAGVQADLEKCLQCLRPDNTIEGFPLGETDFSSWLRFPHKLYGRDSELKELEQAFESACRATPSMMFIGGNSGIGKTALVEEIQRAVSEKQGYFVRGKCDQYLRTTPYAAITQAFAALVSQILAEPEKNFDARRDGIQLAVGDLGKVLTEVVPTLEKLIGTQPDVPELGGQEAENRFNYVFINSLTAAATEKHPLVLFIDDLQWIDAASVRLLKVIQSDFEQPGLLVIGAYRDDEVDASQPFMGILDNQEQTGIPVRILKLSDLQPQHVDTLLSDTLRSQEGIKELGAAIYEKTHGNPFFTRRLLSSLHEEGRIRYDAEANNWKWGIRDIKREAIADNVADLLAQAITELPEETREILKLAACIGNRFDLPTLTLISGHSEQEIVESFATPWSERYFYPSGDSYEFVHDRVQQAGYALVAEEEQPLVHLRIGRSLLSRTEGDELEGALFDIVTHFNLGAQLLDSESEKVTVAELNLKAARKARNATAYIDGYRYVEHGLALLDSKSWQDSYDLTLATYNEAVELAYLTGHYDRLDELEGHIHTNARNILDRAHVYYVRIMADTDQARFLESIETGICALAELGIEIPQEPTPEDYQRFEAAFTEALGSRSIEEVLHMPAMTDRVALAALEIMTPVMLNAYIASPQHSSLFIYKGASLSVQHGNGPWSPFFYTAIAALLCWAVNISPSDKSARAVKAAHALAKVSLSFLENPKYARCKAKALELIVGVSSWNEPLKKVLDLSLKTYQAGLETGDLVYAALGIYLFANYGLVSGTNLDDYQETVSAYRQHVRDIGQELWHRRIGIMLQTAQNFTAPGSRPDVLKGRHFDESQWLPGAVAANDFSSLNSLFLEKLCLSYHFDNDEKLMEYAGEAEKYLESVFGMINTAIFAFYDSLSRLRLYASISKDEREQSLNKVEGNQLRLHIWSQNAPMNFQHKYDLVAAEMARVLGDIGPAMEKYERAIKNAGENGFIHDQALANELYARFWEERGNDRIAEMYMREACGLYDRWGADAKVRHIENRYPQWSKTRAIPTEQTDLPCDDGKAETPRSQSVTLAQMDLDSITSASQLLSAETDLEQLLSKMMALVMANSGAERAVLLLKQGNEWFVQGQSYAGALEYDVFLSMPYDPASRDSERAIVPQPVFNYCRRSREVLVVGEARLDHRFAQDRMIQEHKIQSIACIPSLSQGKLRAMLYLEHRHLADVFTLERLELLKHLSSQFAISVENVLLYENLNQKVRELQKSEAELASHRRHLETMVEERTAQLQEEVVERKKIEAALQTQIDLFESLLEATPDTIEIIDPATMRYIKWNKALTELSGYSDEELASMDSTTSFFDEADLQRVEAAAEQAIREGVAVVAADAILKDGSRLPMEFMASLARDSEGAPLYLVAVGRDITERKQAEEALRESEGKFRALFEGMPVPVYAWQRSGEDFVLVDHNDAADAITDGSVADFLGTTLSAMYPGRPDIVDDVSRCFAERVSFQREMAYAFDYSGEDKDLVVRYAFVPSNLVLVHTEDVSERKQAEEALRESEEQYRNLVEKISDVIYAINREGVITYLSPAAESLLGLPPEQMVGRPLFQSIHPEDLEQAQENVQALLAGGIPGTAEYRLLNALGETRWIRVTSQPIVDGGQVSGFRGVLTDITDRKAMEAQLEEAATTAERQRLARELHDSVTQTLYSLDLFANAAQEALSKGKIETGAEHAQRIRSLSQSALVDMRLLIFELQPPLLEQEGLAGALRARLESVEARAGLTTEFEAMAERPLSPAVESELYAVAREALNNALRHAQADRIIVKLDCDERGCCLTIRDDGVGFDLATTRRTGGFGLRNMADRAERIGGDLTLDTAPGKGTTVRVEVTA